MLNYYFFQKLLQIYIDKINFQKLDFKCMV